MLKICWPYQILSFLLFFCLTNESFAQVQCVDSAPSLPSKASSPEEGKGYVQQMGPSCFLAADTNAKRKFIEEADFGRSIYDRIIWCMVEKGLYEVADNGSWVQTTSKVKSVYDIDGALIDCNYQVLEDYGDPSLEYDISTEYQKNLYRLRPCSYWSALINRDGAGVLFHLQSRVDPSQAHSVTVVSVDKNCVFTIIDSNIPKTPMKVRFSPWGDVTFSESGNVKYDQVFSAMRPRLVGSYVIRAKNKN